MAAALQQNSHSFSGVHTPHFRVPAKRSSASHVLLLSLLLLLSLSPLLLLSLSPLLLLSLSLLLLLSLSLLLLLVLVL